MANEVVEILVKFLGDTRELNKATGDIESGMDSAGGSIDIATKKTALLKTAAVAAGAAAAAMAAKWAVEGIAIATDAARIEENFRKVVGETADFSHEIETLAGHMGLAQHEAEQLLADASALGQSMGMGQEEANAFSKEMFQLAGDMAQFNPEAGDAADAMDAILKASNGSTKGLAAWDVSLKNSEITARALANTGKETAAALTQDEKATATLQLTTEKMAAAQGSLNEAMADGSTEVKEAKADIDDMQVAVGEALMPIKKLALEALLILADVLIALQPAIEAIGELLAAVLEIITPLIDIIAGLASIIAGVLSAAISGLMNLLRPLIDLLSKASQKFGAFTSKVRSFKMPSFKLPSFHSGGTVPGATGSLQPIMAQGGETIGRPGGGGGGGGAPSTVVNITVNAGLSSPMDTARTIADLLETYTQSNGAINVKVRG